MHFEVNGIPYFLSFSAEGREWVLVTPTSKGIQRMSVETDDPPFVNQLMMDTDEGTKKIVN